MKFPATIVLVLSCLLTLAGCSWQGAAPEAKEPATDETSARNELASRAGAPLFDDMGSHHHPITTNDPDAQRYFDQCLELAEEHGLGRIIAANLSLRSYVSCWQNDIDSAIAGYREAIHLAVQIKDPRAQMMALMIGGSFWSLVGDAVEGEKWLRSSMKIIRRIGAGLFEGVCVYLLGRFALLRGDRVQARTLTQRGIAILQQSESGMTFGGPIALGILALAAEDEEQCHAALLEAETILSAGSVGHNYLNFYEDAMEACLQFEAWEAVERYALALQDYTRPEPLPRSDYFIARGRALAAFGRGRRDENTLQTLQQLCSEADKNGFKLSRHAIDAALEAG